MFSAVPAAPPNKQTTLAVVFLFAVASLDLIPHSGALTNGVLYGRERPTPAVISIDDVLYCFYAILLNKTKMELKIGA